MLKQANILIKAQAQGRGALTALVNHPVLGRGPLAKQPGSTLSMRHNSTALMLNVLVSAGLGYLFWIVAARLYKPEEVGLASGAISAMTLCGQVALLGTGSAIITLLPRNLHRASHFLSVAFSMVFTLGLVAAGIFLLLASTFFTGLGVIAATPAYAFAFLAMGALWSVSLVLDQTSLALRRSDHTLARSVVSGATKLGALGVFALLSGGNSIAIFLTWVTATCLVCVLGYRQLRRALEGFTFRPTVAPATSRETLAAGLPNYGLSMALLSPGLIIPLVVTEVLSPAMNAYWYAAWMVAGLVFIVPSSNGMALFSEASNRPDTLQRGIIGSIKMSLGVGVPVALCVALASQWVLPVLGKGYGQVGAALLPILVAAVIPQSFIETYVAACRATRKRAEAALACSANGVLAIGGAVLGGLTLGLPGVALAWLGAQTLTGIWAGIRIWQMSHVQREFNTRKLSINDIQTEAA